MKNNNLIIYYKDKSRDVFSFASDVSEEQAISKFEAIRPEVDKEQIEKYFYHTNDELPIEMYGKFTSLTEEGKIEINTRAVMIEERLDDIRKKRDLLISKLDIPFMRALEDDNDTVKNHIKKIKNFLRDLPSKLRFHELNDEDILSYNPFGNILEIAIITGGSGYQSPPKVTIDEPKRPAVGFAPKVVATIKDGAVSKLILTDFGCGYNFVPKVEIEAPENGERALALCLPPQNTVLTEEQIFENTRSNYQ
tara:strand:+ start:391 stop:1143 length:753 start_codon:yes stop_codon:yes gene_type:complete